jgi:hypothetical protein
MAEFKINDKTYTLITDPDLDQMCEAEEAFGKNFGESRMSTAKMLFWISAKAAGDDLSVEEIGALKASVLAEMEADALPPVPRLVEPNNASGGSSEAPSDIPDDPMGSGNPGSDTGSDSARETFFASLQLS